MKPISLALTAGLLLSVFSLSAQWGKVIPTMVQASSFAPFEGEDAIILHKSAAYEIVSLPSGWEARIHHYVRLKIQTQEGIDYGDIELYYYPNKRRKEIARFKGQVHYMEDGEMKTEEVSKVYKEKLNADVSVLRCAFPHVQPGTIIEYQYDELRSSIFAYSFEFQEDIPVLHSEFEWYPKDEVGYAFAYQGAQIEGLQKVGSDKDYHWKMEKLPALRDAPFVPNLEDYRSKLTMQLSVYYNRGRGLIEHVLGTWEDFTKEMYEERRFAKFHKKGGTLAKLAAQITADVDEPAQKLNLLHAYVRDRMKWNGEYRIFADQPVEKLLEKGEGSSAEINLVLASLIQKAGLEAHPVLVSTRKNGQAVKAYPMLNQFNSLLVWAKAGETEYFMDATLPYLDMDMLPRAYLNTEGWILDREQGRWGKIQTQVPQKRTLYVNAAVNEEGGLTGTFKDEVTGYLALSVKATYSELGKEAFLAKYLPKRYPGLELSETEIEIPEAYNAPVHIKGSFKLMEAQIPGSSLQYVQPFQGWGLTENPLKQEYRTYPLDFMYPEQELITLVINLPEGWKVEEKPENIAFTIPDRTALFQFNASQLGQLIQIQSRYVRKSPFYEAVEYPSLRQIYTEVHSRHTSPIVLKKPEVAANGSADE